VPTIIVNSGSSSLPTCLLYQWTGIKSPLLDTILGKGDYKYKRDSYDPVFNP